MIQTALLIFNIVAAFNGFLVAVALIFQERFGPAKVRMALAGFLFMISILLALFVALDTGMVDYVERLGVLMDLMALSAGALFLTYVAEINAYSARFWFFLPPVFYLVSVVIAGGRYLGPTDIAPVIAAQIAYSVAAFILYWIRRNSLPSIMSRRRENRHMPALFLGIAMLHGAQLLRLAFPGSGFFFDLVPLVGSMGLMVLIAYSIIGSQTLVGFGRVPPVPQTGKTTSAEKALLESKCYLDPDLSVQKAAEIAGVGTRDLSAYLNHEKGQSFREFINDLRIAEAERLLAAPEECATSVEAIGMLSGFRSRSSFYQAFKQRTGITPAEFRKSVG